MELVSRLSGVLVLFLSLMGMADSVQAKAVSIPLIIAIAGNSGSGSVDADLWAWYGVGQPLKQLTHYGHNGIPVYSPDGKFVAYQSMAKELLPLFARGNGISGELDSDIWLLEVATDEAVALNAQPAGYKATVKIDGTVDVGIIRSDPVWSPDGKFLAWTEADPTGQNRLMSYDLRQKQSKGLLLDILSGS